MVGADEQPDEVRHDDADESDRAADGHRGARRERCAEERPPLRPRDGYAPVSALSGPSDSRFSGRASHAKATNDTASSGSAATIG